ncbi:MAG: hypothetical protein DMG96_28685 [Acidobacteria bacterium]|nr:MAG: hypothetical protein DMG96_28685 [Acidobacteriota bacterium]HEU0048175.1 hypothetical protein [Nitrososphaera sp.]
MYSPLFSPRFRYRCGHVAFVKCLPLYLALVTPAGANPQDNKAEPISVHVKEVHRNADAEPTDKGAWFHITAVAETKTIIYSLKCDEFYSYAKRDYAVGCFHLAAGKDYSGFRAPTALNFWKPEDKNKGYTLAVYEIVSEKEK